MDRTYEDIENEIQKSEKRLHYLNKTGDVSEISREKMNLGQLYCDLDDRRDMDMDEDEYDRDF